MSFSLKAFEGSLREIFFSKSFPQLKVFGYFSTRFLSVSFSTEPKRNWCGWQFQDGRRLLSEAEIARRTNGAMDSLSFMSNH
jgi:hypothetical protein